MFSKLPVSPLVFLPKTRPLVHQLLVATITVACIVFIKIWIPDIGRDAPFLLFTTGVILCGWYEGFVSSITATILSSLIVSFIFIAPFGVLDNNPAMTLQAGVFMAESFLLSFLIKYIKKMILFSFEQNQFIQTVANATCDYAIICIDAQESIIGWSKGAQKIFGYKKEEVQGKSLSYICDKKNWFDRKAHTLRVRVQTHCIYTIDHKISFKIKLLRLVRGKGFLYTEPELLPDVSFIAQQVIPSSQIL